MKCSQCNEPMICVGESSTYAGFLSPPGHDHNDNCIRRIYQCDNGHRVTLSKRRRCHCGWKGAASCFCCGDKVDLWPEELEEVK